MEAETGTKSPRGTVKSNQSLSFHSTGKSSVFRVGLWTTIEGKVKAILILGVTEEIRGTCPDHNWDKLLPSNRNSNQNPEPQVAWQD